MRKAQGLVEYGLILGLIAVVAIAVLTLRTGDGRHGWQRGFCHEVDAQTHDCRVTQLEQRVATLEKQGR